ncbi:MAG: GxxExxY protein [Phycisphaerae bacterium]|jgi:GxxExxY protein
MSSIIAVFREIGIMVGKIDGNCYALRAFRRDSRIILGQDKKGKSFRDEAMQYEDITEKIIGCAYEMYNRMGFGFLESVYRNCLMIELKKASLKTEAEKPIVVMYEGGIVGEFKADIVVEDNIIVELKSVRQLTKIHEAQLVNYLVATGKPIGLLINFGEQKVDVRRKVKDLAQYEVLK